jgi:hypothetical protein
MNKKVKKIINKFKGKPPRLILPMLYISIVFLGFIVALINLFTDILTICPTFFGSSVCAPLGVYIGLIVSIPGYIIATNLLPFVGDLIWFFSLVIVIIISLLFYTFLGWMIEIFKSDKRTDEKVKLLIILVFSVLLLVVILFSLSL